MLITRADRGILARWWFTIDWPLLSAAAALLSAGVVMSLAASPAVAERLGLDDLHFFTRHGVFALIAFATAVATSFLTPRQARYAALVVYIASLALMAAAIIAGPEIKGAHRWISLGGYSLQPSEFMKPGFIVLAAWALSHRSGTIVLPPVILGWAIFAAPLLLLAMQPDFGQSLLLCGVWVTMLLIHGLPWKGVAALSGLAVVGSLGAYYTMDHVAMRIDRFLNPENHDTFQLDMAKAAFENGGWPGVGPGMGTAKQLLPDAHADFTFAVISEEFGLIACLGLIAAMAFVVIRLLGFARRAQEPFRLLSVTGLAAGLALQALVNMAVNVSLVPAKGMTLPFISYGGSSLIASAFSLGLALALARANAPALPAATQPDGVRP